MKICTLSKCFFLLMLIAGFAAGAQSYTYTKTRPSELNTTAYKQIAIGDIVGPLGNRTEESMNLTDALGTVLFNKNAQEIIDRNALDKILSANSELTTIDEKTVTQLKKKLINALLITGRIQADNVSQQELSEQGGTCPYKYWWKATCNVTVQIKIVEVSTGKMIYTGPIQENTVFESTPNCKETGKFDPSYIIRSTTDSVAERISHLLVPYQESITLYFAAGTIFKHPFKKLPQVCSDFQMNKTDDGLTILKGYATDGSLKSTLLAQAHYNYGLGLFLNNQYDAAKTEFKNASDLDAQQMYQNWYQLVDKEKFSDSKLASASK